MADQLAALGVSAEPAKPEADTSSDAAADTTAAAADDDAADGGDGDADGGDANEPDLSTMSKKERDKYKKKQREKAKKAAAKGGGEDKSAAGKGTKGGGAIKKMLQEQEQARLAAQAEADREHEEMLAREAAKEEAARVEAERKAAVKAKKKAKLEEKKKAGLILTPKQKQAQEKLKAMMAANGMSVPGLASNADDADADDAPKAKAKPVYKNKKKQPKKDEPTPEPVKEPEASASDDDWDASGTDDEGEKDDEPVDDWDASSDEEEDARKAEEDAKKKAAKEEKKANKEKEFAAKQEAKAAAAKAKKEKDAADAAARAADDAKLLEAMSSAAADYGGVEVGEMRSPLIAVLGHVDTGKTKILDKIRKTSVQDGEAGGITQQIGASFFPGAEVNRQISKVKAANNFNNRLPGLLIMDTPGHESFANLRDRGSSLCNIAILVVDIMHGLEPQTIESIGLLRDKKTPFVIALNKIDRITDWKATPNAPVQTTLRKQKGHTLDQYEILTQRAMLQMNEQGFNCALYYDNKDNSKTFTEDTTINVVPTSAHTGEGIPDLLFTLCRLTQQTLKKEVTFTGELNATVLEVKKIDGYGTTIDVILADGTLHEGQQMVLCGLEGPIVTTIRSLLMPEPLKEMRVKNNYRLFKSVPAANGVKIAARDLDKAIAGLKVHIARDDEHVEELKLEVMEDLEATLEKFKTKVKGVHVQCSTLGAMEALLCFLKVEKIPVSGLSIGPVNKSDVTRCSVQLTREPKNAMILAFDVPVERDAQIMADGLGIKIFTADIIYHLEEAFRTHVAEVKERERAQFASRATFPCRLKILPDCIFNARDPIVMGVQVTHGILKVGTPITVPGKGFCDLGVVLSIEIEHKPQETVGPGIDVCIKIDAAGGDKKLFGRHFDADDELISKVSRESIDAVKKYFREDLSKADWILMKKLKDVFEII